MVRAPTCFRYNDRLAVHLEFLEWLFLETADIRRKQDGGRGGVTISAVPDSARVQGVLLGLSMAPQTEVLAECLNDIIQYITIRYSIITIQQITRTERNIVRKQFIRFLFI